MLLSRQAASDNGCHELPLPCTCAQVPAREQHPGRESTLRCIQMMLLNVHTSYLLSIQDDALYIQYMYCTLWNLT